jgi:hypothetical protein
MLQSEAGYIDARPHIRQLDEVLLQRTAGPYIWVKTGKSSDGAIVFRSSPNSGHSKASLARPLSAISGHWLTSLSQP